jgi:DNA polymerase I-like protein with 3'-5' exonuclease and polymerase domains
MGWHLIDAPKIIAVDTETTGLGFYDRPFGATVTWRRHDGTLTSAYFELEGDDGIRAGMLQRILRRTPQWVGHNLKFDLQKLALAGIVGPDEWPEHELHDTQTIFHLLDENAPKGLKKLAVSVLRYDDTVEVEVKSGPNKGSTKLVPKEEYQLAAARRRLGLRKEDGYHLLPRELLIPYALRDTEFTLRLYEVLLPRLMKTGGDKLYEWYRTEMDLVPVVLRMEADGISLDTEYLDETASEYGVRVMEAWGRITALTGRPDLNPNAPAQLLEAFRARGLRLDSTDVATLEPLDDELAQAVLAYRSDQKVYKTYLRGLQDEHRDGLFHPNFNLVGPRTGRTSSGSAKE